jgi:hypothetical protein
MTIFFLVLGVMGFVMAAMAVGVMLKRPCLRGSCGGPEMAGPDGESLSCATCPNRQRSET